jgi:hypothetical protein
MSAPLTQMPYLLKKNQVAVRRLLLKQMISGWLEQAPYRASWNTRGHSAKRKCNRARDGRWGATAECGKAWMEAGAKKGIDPMVSAT